MHIIYIVYLYIVCVCSIYDIYALNICIYLIYPISSISHIYIIYISFIIYVYIYTLYTLYIIDYICIHTYRHRLFYFQLLISIRFSHDSIRTCFTRGFILQPLYLHECIQYTWISIFLNVGLKLSTSYTWGFAKIPDRSQRACSQVFWQS